MWYLGFQVNNYRQVQLMKQSAALQVAEHPSWLGRSLVIVKSPVSTVRHFQGTAAFWGNLDECLNFKESSVLVVVFIVAYLVLFYLTTKQKEFHIQIPYKTVSISNKSFNNEKFCQVYILGFIVIWFTDPSEKKKSFQTNMLRAVNEWKTEKNSLAYIIGLESPRAFFFFFFLE